MEETIKILPCIPLRGKVIFPNTTLFIDVGRAKSVASVKTATEKGGEIFICAQRNDAVEDPQINDLYEVGVIALVRQVSKSGANLRVTVQAVGRAAFQTFSTEGENYVAGVSPLSYEGENEAEIEASVRVVKELISAFPTTNSKQPAEAFRNLLSLTEANVLCNVAAHQMGFSKEAKQAILSENKTVERLKLLASHLNAELEIINVQKKITDEVRKNIDQNQKEYFLREQIKAIHKELGDDEAENEKIVEQIKAKKLPEPIREKALKEMARLDKMPPSTPESTVIRNYIDLLLDLPFMEGTEDNTDVFHAEQVLDEDHFGLEKIKRRVVEYLAVHALTKSLKGPILCFVGPPGVGKTSIARSIARAMGRKFVRMSLGGLKDEAEIRGHRRTYVGAMPGRIIYEIRAAKTNNPVFLLDEIDKISSDMRGDPASALLEVLDPEQNATYRDRYLEEEFDLSNVMFIATANTLETIPAPLRDRMEIVELSGYTTEEKVQIAKRYLLPKKLAEHGISSDQISVTDGAFRKMAERYTMEAGVRNLERVVADVCRKYAVSFVKNPKIGKAKVTEQNLEKYLGKPKYTLSDAMDRDLVGVCNGLAWTAVGGVTLEVEVNLMRGKGELKLTGSLGDVMKESALTALSYIRANAENFGIDPERFEKTDIHLHVPEGATPKDGPSAGITIATALYSAFTGKKVKKSVAMTGEITLRGRVLPIGGLKEKSLAAIRRGVTTVIAPKENEKDLEDIPSYLLKDVNFVFVTQAEEVFAIACRND